MPAIRTKSVWTPMDRKGDGLRVLVTRYIPRACPGTRYSVWMANLGPSERLLKSYQAGRIEWADFAQRYESELFESSGMDRHNPRIKNYGQKFTLRLLRELARRQPITLMCNCAEEESQCHRHLLKTVLESSRI
jgi:uncharacterized protein YeaO (DUF488 family)